MDPEEFKDLRRLPGKEVSADVKFERAKELPDYVVVFNGVTVENSMGLPVVAAGRYNRKKTSLTIHFTLEGCGQICRICVRGANHGNEGRTHRHYVKEPGDVEKGLPHAVARPDWESLTPTEVWEIICRDSHILHSGVFIDPSEELQ